ncbi:unnamed protein product [Cuscuta epithymum]|uniref:Helitron helicase-like domain-containing protein n=1 Tax=Cuscuta epithymum TaxID=186058 RepID=A0AAV0EIV9_9ASTE|nr:unnamed protein product [Cuscuta epithymum]
MCCSKGEFVLTSTEMPEQLVQLFTAHDPLSKHFRSCVRTYNNTFAFTSIGIYNYDKSLCRRNQGIYTFRVQGQIYHFINDLLPDGCPPRNLQLYFYDTDHALSSRLESTDRLDKDVVQVLMEVMCANPYAQFFKTLGDVEQAGEFSIVLNGNPCLDQHVYNRPATSQVAAVWVEDGYEGAPSNRNIRVYAHSGRSQNIHYYYGCYDPLQYPLLFPRGEVGWHEGIARCPSGVLHPGSTPTNSLSINTTLFGSGESLIAREELLLNTGQKRHSISCREYYAYKLQLRRADKALILHSGRLFQQYIVDIYIKIETQRLDYYRSKQRDYRGETYQGLVDSVSTGIQTTSDVGRRVILPGSFIGGPRDMRGRYMDAMALVQNYGKPDLFITITCNPSWPEIKNRLKFADEAQNRPDLVARVFRARLEDFKKDIISKSLFGKVVAYTYVIEFQKRGLPHAHFLVILSRECKITTSARCDQLITAELPDPITDPGLYLLVKKHMLHGPCGTINPQCPCMVVARGSGSPTCRNKFPRNYSAVTEFHENCFPAYRRRESGITVIVRKHSLDNRWVVPYNAQLLRKYDCHINVEVCASVKSVKYIYKYVYKGHDRISMSLSETREDEVIDEISDFQKARWVSAPEAAWRIFSFPISEMRPAVLSLQVHLENSQYLTFYGNQRITLIRL